MAKYKLIATSVTIEGKVFKKRNNPILEDGKIDSALLAAAEKAGFIAEIKIEKKVKKQEIEEVKPE